MSINNFDKSSNGTDLELVCFYDTEMAQTYFEDCIEIIQHGNYSRHTIAKYNQCGETWELSAEINPDSYRELTGLVLNDYSGDIRVTVKDFYRCFGYMPSKADHLSAIELSDFLGVDFLEFCEKYSDYLAPNFKAYKTRGYSQGDYALVYYPIDLEYSPENEIDQLFWDAPVYCQLEINGEEIYLGEYMKDVYSYNKDELLQAVKPLEWCNEYVYEWLVENLPEHPDYY